MSRFTLLRRSFAGLLLMFAACVAMGADTVRPEVGKPLKAAEALLKSGHGREALARVNEADAVPSKTPYENLLIEQMRGSAAHAAGDLPTAIRAFESVIGSGHVAGRQQLALVQAVAVDNYKLRNYAKSAQWAQRYFKEGGTEPAMRTVLLQSYYLGNDCGSVARMLAPSVGESGGRKPSEEELQILANCYLREKDTGGYVSAIERLVLYYPKKDYWTDLLSRVQKKPGFSDRLGIHVYRLRLATGNFTSAADYMELAQLALQAGVPAEARQVVDKGYASGLLGKGDQAERQGRLRELVNRSLEASRKSREQDERNALDARDGSDLVKVGLNYVYDGKPDKGLALVEKGIKKGGFKHPEEDKLLLGEALLAAGHRSRAVQVLRTVRGNDGTADLARLWVLQARA